MPRLAQGVAVIYIGLWLVVLGASLGCRLVPGAPAAAREALALALDGGGAHTFATAVALGLHNAAVAGWPLALAALGLRDNRWTRSAVDLAVVATVAANAGLVGVALGAYGVRLIPYLIQLPVEFAAVALGAAAWFGTRQGKSDKLELTRTALLLVFSVLLAAALEVYATPTVSR
jgi:hypothetical protein